MAATLDHDVSGLQDTIAELQRRFDEAVAERDGLLAERDEALARETATAEVLQVISQSTFDLEQVLQTILDTAVRLCRAGPSEIFRLESDGYRFAVGNGMEPRYKEFERTVVLQPE